MIETEETQKNRGTHVLPFLTDVSQLRKVYSTEGLNSILDNCHIKICYGNAGSDTAEAISEEFAGRRPLKEETVSEKLIYAGQKGLLAGQDLFKPGSRLNGPPDFSLIMSATTLDVGQSFRKLNKPAASKRYGVRLGRAVYWPKFGRHMLVVLVRRRSVKLFNPATNRLITTSMKQYLKQARNVVCCDEGWSFLASPDLPDLDAYEKQCEFTALGIVIVMASFMARKGWRMPKSFDIGAIVSDILPYPPIRGDFKGIGPYGRFLAGAAGRSGINK